MAREDVASGSQRAAQASGCLDVSGAPAAAPPPPPVFGVTNGSVAPRIQAPKISLVTESLARDATTAEMKADQSKNNRVSQASVKFCFG